MNIKDLLPNLLLSIQQKAMRNENSVSLGGGECFDIPTPVLLFLHYLRSRDLLSVVTAHMCKNVELFLVMLTCRLDILAR